MKKSAKERCQALDLFVGTVVRDNAEFGKALQMTGDTTDALDDVLETCRRFSDKYARFADDLYRLYQPGDSTIIMADMVQRFVLDKELRTILDSLKVLIARVDALTEDGGLPKTVDARCSLKSRLSRRRSVSEGYERQRNDIATGRVRTVSESGSILSRAGSFLSRTSCLLTSQSYEQPEVTPDLQRSPSVYYSVEELMRFSMESVVFSIAPEVVDPVDVSSLRNAKGVVLYPVSMLKRLMTVLDQLASSADLNCLDTVVDKGKLRLLYYDLERLCRTAIGSPYFEKYN